MFFLKLMVAIAITQKQRNKAKMENKIENQLFYRVKQVSKILGIGEGKLYALLNDKSLGIDQKRLGGHLAQRKNGAVPRSSIRLITQQGLDQLVNLINNELI